MKQIAVGVGVGAAKQRFYEGFPVLSAVFQDWAYVVGKEIAAPSSGATGWARAVGDCREIKGLGGAGIALEVPLESQPMINVNYYPASPAVQ